MSDRRRSKVEPPHDDDPSLVRTCTDCGRKRHWGTAYCRCGNPEFTLPRQWQDNLIDRPYRSTRRE